MGCGGQKQPISKPITKKSKPEYDQKINTGPLECTHRDPSQKRLWHIQAEKSHIMYSNQGKTKCKFNQTHGILFVNDQEICSFQADHTVADQLNNTLTLEGHILLKSKKYLTQLTASTAVWDGSKKLFYVTGNVMLDSPKYSLGPFEKLITDSHLNDLGTPDTFEETLCVF